MYYIVSHLTRYTYSEPITGSIMEVRKQPRNDGNQSSLDFELTVSPKVKVLYYVDYLGNVIHTFDIPGHHRRLAIKADAVVEVRLPAPLPDSLPMSAWDVLRNRLFDRRCYDMLQTSQFTRPSAYLHHFIDELNLPTDVDPLTLLRVLNERIYDSLDYDQSVTTVDSHIDEALEQHKGVCQDFAHIMIAIVRGLGIPCRYVSGYLFHRSDREDRSAQDESHAWVEAWLPELGWVGFDPTNNLICKGRHIRVCIGRDYADAAPTKGVFSGTAETQLDVVVNVEEIEQPPAKETPVFSFAMPDYDYQNQQQQQDQQQQ